MRRTFGLVGLLLLLLLAVLIGRTLLVGPAPDPGGSTEVPIAVDAERAAQRLSEAIRFETLSTQDTQNAQDTQDTDAPDIEDAAEGRAAAFEALIAWVEETWPGVHAELERERVADFSLLYTWRGTDPRLDPVLLTAHYDVVPVIPGSESQWTHPPFAGRIADGYVWGRGALDDKSGVVAQLEAVSLLIAQGFRPARTVYLSFGHDEEVGGGGAAAVTDLLAARGVDLEWSIDEGSFVLTDGFPGVDAAVASINVAEKGYVSLELVARGQGGHSSMPPRHTAAGVLAAAIVKLEENPMPAVLDGFAADMLNAIAPSVPFGLRVVLANRWLFGPVIERTLAGSPASDAMLRTTTATTMLRASVKENVLPIEAVAVVNFRIHPRDSVDEVIAHVERVVDDDRIEVRRTGEGTPPSAVSSSASRGYQDIATALRVVYGDLVVMPGLTVGGTDSRHYGRVARDAYRLNPMSVSRADIAGFHGTDERIGVESLARGIAVYARLIRGGPPDRGRDAGPAD